MNIITKSVHIINRDENKVEFKDISHSDFDSYIFKLVDFIFENNKVREYKTRDFDTGVVRTVTDIASCIIKQETEKVITHAEKIALRLVRTEIEVQELIERLGKEVQRGSLVQAFIVDEDTEMMYYLITKVEHSAWRDESDFIKKIGFPEDNKNIWKSTIMEISTTEEDEIIIGTVHCYVNNNATYWSNEFLELDELISDEINTKRAFKAVESSLRKRLNTNSKTDYLQLRNDLIGCFRREQLFHYDTVINSLFEGYESDNLSTNELNGLKNDLLALPNTSTKPFDRQFNSIPKQIPARMSKKILEVTQGIQLNLNGHINDFRDKIFSTEREGAQYVVMKTDNTNTYNSFPKKDF